MVCTRIALPFFACLVSAWPTHATGATVPDRATWVSLGFGLPVPVGGIVSIDVHHRLDPKTFVQFGGGSALILQSAYLSYGRVTDLGGYAIAGLDASVLTDIFSGESTYLPGAHIGYGWQWFPGGTRIAVVLTGGFPSLGGVRVTVGR